MKKEIYLDNAATTRPLETVVSGMADTMLNIYGNPSSLHKKGIEAENKIKVASQFLASKIGCLPEEIIYTSGGTESNNTAIIGAALAHKRTGNKIITTAIEHPSVAEVYRYLEGQGFEVYFMPVDHEGNIDLDALKAEIDGKTIIVSIMHVNNELGTIAPIEQIGALIKAVNPNTLFHVDAVQSFGKLPIHVKRAKIDLLSTSAHKIYGPRGIGFLYKNKNCRIQNILHGGGHQKNMRSGTENTPGVVGMQLAAEYVFNEQEAIKNHMMLCKKTLAEGILAALPDVKVNGPELENGAPHILNMSFTDVRAEVLLHTLEEDSIYVSSGSACSSQKKAKMGVLAAIGNKGQDLDNAIRFSFAHDTKVEDLETVIEVLKLKVPMLRRFTVGGRK